MDEIPVFESLVGKSLSLQAYIVRFDVLTPLTPITSIRPDAFGVPRVDPVEIAVPDLPGGLPGPSLRLRVWDPAAGSSYSDAGPFFNGQSRDFILIPGAIYTPFILVIPEPSPILLFTAGSAAWALCRHRNSADRHDSNNLAVRAPRTSAARTALRYLLRKSVASDQQRGRRGNQPAQKPCPSDAETTGTDNKLVSLS